LDAGIWWPFWLICDILILITLSFPIFCFLQILYIIAYCYRFFGVSMVERKEGIEESMRVKRRRGTPVAAPMAQLQISGGGATRGGEFIAAKARRRKDKTDQRGDAMRQRTLQVLLLLE
jgi:hypothetical protein